MDDTTTLIVEKFAAPVLSGALGFAGAAFRFYMRIRNLERDMKSLRGSVKTLATSQGFYGSQLGDLIRRVEIIERLDVSSALGRSDRSIESLRAGMKLEIEHLRNELEAMIAEVRSSMRDVEDSTHDFAKEAALAQFMAQQATRWEQIQHTLGRIQGLMERSK